MSEDVSWRGSNLPRVGDFNQTVVLNLIRQAADGVSRVELASRTGLSAQTVSNIVRRLTSAGLIAEAGKVSARSRDATAGPGKPRTLLKLQRQGRLAVGVQIDPAMVSIAIVDLMGEVVRTVDLPLHGNDEPGAVLDSVAQAVGMLVDEVRTGAEQILGLGVATPGPIDVVHGVMVKPPLMPRWANTGVRDALALRTGLQVVFDSDANAIAVAEGWTSGAPSTASFAVVYLGTGVGGGVVLNGEVLRGESGNGSDIAHLSVDPDGAPCRCGSRGCLGAECKPSTIVRRAAAAGLPGLDTALEDPGDVAAAFARFAAQVLDGDARAVEIAGRTAAHLARGAIVLAAALVLPSVAFAGPYWMPLAQWYLPRIEAELEGARTRWLEHPPAVSSSRVGAAVGAVGAACTVLDAALSPRTTTLLVPPIPVD